MNLCEQVNDISNRLGKIEKILADKAQDPKDNEVLNRIELESDDYIDEMDSDGFCLNLKSGVVGYREFLAIRRAMAIVEKIRDEE